MGKPSRVKGSAVGARPPKEEWRFRLTQRGGMKAIKSLIFESPDLASLRPDGSGGLGGVRESGGRIGIKGAVRPAAVIVNCGAWCVWRPVAASAGTMG